MLVDVGMVAFGLALLLGGGDAMVRGATALAGRLGVAPLVIGLTVVAFGTSAPELAVNVTAAWQGNAGVSFGNIFGSNMANIGLIVAGTALVRPLEIHGLVLRREVPMMILATAVAAGLGLDAVLGASRSIFGRGDGLVLLLLFTVFMYYTVNDVLIQRERRAAMTSSLAGAGAPVTGLEVDVGPTPGLARSMLFTVGGLMGLVVGAQFTVDGAVALARDLGVPEAIVGLTLVAVGTSLPELAASLVAVLKGHSDIAVGNVVGSNIFNLLIVLGASAAIRPVPVPVGGAGDVAVTGLLSLLLWLTAASERGTIIRGEALLLLGVYLAYVAWRMLA